MLRCWFLIVVLGGAGCSADPTDPGPPPSTGTTTLRVPADFASIRTATQAASPGDTVLVAPGTYRELVVVTTGAGTRRAGVSLPPGVTLRGEGAVVLGTAGSITVHVQGAAKRSAEPAVLENVTLEPGSSEEGAVVGIRVEGGASLRVGQAQMLFGGGTLPETAVAMFATGASWLEVHDSVFRRWRHGVLAQGASQVGVERVTFDEVERGVVLTEAGTTMEVRESWFLGGLTGVSTLETGGCAHVSRSLFRDVATATFFVGDGLLASHCTFVGGGIAIRGQAGAALDVVNSLSGTWRHRGSNRPRRYGSRTRAWPVTFRRRWTWAATSPWIPGSWIPRVGTTAWAPSRRAWTPPPIPGHGTAPRNPSGSMAGMISAFGNGRPEA